VLKTHGEMVRPGDDLPEVKAWGSPIFLWQTEGKRGLSRGQERAFYADRPFLLVEILLVDPACLRPARVKSLIRFVGLQTAISKT
jgi:hypothetical protein